MEFIRFLVIFCSPLLVSISALPYHSKNILPQLCQTNDDCHLNEICFDHVCQDKYYKDDTPIMKENYCFSNDDCPSTYICNKQTSRCEIVTTIEQIMSKQKCKSVFKQFCTASSQCACNEKKMVCENYECVEEKEKTNGMCLVHTDCPVAFMCDQGTCREPKTIQELMQLFQPVLSNECQVESDCKNGQHCVNGACSNKPKTKKTKKTKKKLRKCYRKMIGTFCSSEKQCNTTCGSSTVSKLTCSNNKCELKRKKRWKKQKTNIKQFFFSKPLN